LMTPQFWQCLHMTVYATSITAAPLCTCKCAVSKHTEAVPALDQLPPLTGCSIDRLLHCEDTGGCKQREKSLLLKANEWVRLAETLAKGIRLAV
jgi:hypothetical protein